MKKRIVTLMLVCLLVLSSMSTSVVGATKIIDLSNMKSKFNVRVDASDTEDSPRYFTTDNGKIYVDIHNYGEKDWEIRLFDITESKPWLVESLYINGEYRTRYSFKDLEEKHLYRFEVHNRSEKDSYIKMEVRN